MEPEHRKGHHREALLDAVEILGVNGRLRPIAHDVAVAVDEDLCQHGLGHPVDAVLRHLNPRRPCEDVVPVLPERRQGLVERRRPEAIEGLFQSHVNARMHEVDLYFTVGLQCIVDAQPPRMTPRPARRLRQKHDLVAAKQAVRGALELLRTPARRFCLEEAADRLVRKVLSLDTDEQRRPGRVSLDV